jgi:hypothetical protein
MKHLRILFSFVGSLGLASIALAQSFAPTADIANTYFTGTLTGSTGGENGDGMVLDFFSNNGQDYSVSDSGAFSNPVAYVFANTDANSATITESGVTIALTYTSATTGSFVATYGSGGTQTGTFTVNAGTMEVPLTNVSCLTNVPAGGTSIIGFYIGGSVTHTVLIRAVGPALQSYGVTGTLMQPTLELWSSGSSSMIASGTSTTSALETVYSTVGAFSLPIGSPDSALVATIGPGGYTAQVTGGSATDAGKVLIEVYYLN